VNLTATVTPNLSNGPTLLITPSNVNLAAQGPNSLATSTITITIPSAAQLVAYKVTVNGTAIAISENVNVTLLPTVLQVRPSPIISNGATGPITVSVTASAAQLFSWQFQLNYNPKILSASRSDVSFGSFWKAALSSGKAFTVLQVNQTGGYVSVATTLLDNATTLPFTGNATLASINFTVLALGVSSLQLSYSLFEDPNGHTMPFIQKAGVFCNGSCLDHDVAITSVTVKPSDATVGDTITIIAIVANVGLNPENVTVNILVGSNSIYQRQVSLDPGATANITTTWNTKTAAANTYTIKAVATIIGNQDLNPADDTMSGNVVLKSASLTSGLSLPLILYTAGGLAAAAAVTAFLLLRRRRLSAPFGPEEIPSGQGLNEISSGWDSP
jgi:hypothetical protein